MDDGYYDLGGHSFAVTTSSPEAQTWLRLQADASILGWFALPAGATPAVPLPDLFTPPPVFEAPGELPSLHRAPLYLAPPMKA